MKQKMRTSINPPAGPLEHRLWAAIAVVVMATAGPPGHSGAQALPSDLRSIDVYRTTQLDTEEVLQRYEPAIREILAAMAADDRETMERVANEVVDSIQASGDFAQVGLGFTTSFEQEVNAVHVTIEVVDRADAEERLSFDPEPPGSVADPDGVLAAWDEYQTIGFELTQSRQISPGPVECPAHHCVSGFDHEALAPYLERFDRAAREHRSELVQVLREDANADKRATAAFVLAHSEDSGLLVRDLVPSIDDPASGVRNNVLRVLMMVAMQDDTFEIPFAPVARRLDDPDSGCRNKAAYLIAALADRPKYREDILASVPAVLRLLRLQKPNNHEPAYEILKTISGTDFGARNYDRWEEWMEEASLPFGQTGSR